MKLIHRLALTVAFLALSNAALAQAGGGHGGPGGSGGPGGGPGGMEGGPGGGPGAGLGGGDVTIAPDGKVLVSERIAGATATAAATYKLVAVSTTGTVAWSYTAPAPFHRVVTLPDLVILSFGGDRGSTTATATPGQLVALNLSTGVQTWTATVDGTLGNIEVASNGLVVTVVKTTAATTTAVATVTRTLQFISASGTVVWSLALPV